MSEYYIVEFKGFRREHFYNPTGLNFRPNDPVVVQAERGEDLGRIRRESTEQESKRPDRKTFSILRPATSDDLDRLAVNRAKEEESLQECLALVQKHRLPMKLVDVEYQFDCNKITFFFTADRRVDFRELVKELANTYRTRIELRQIGVRDEAKRLGGYGCCGLKQCCCTFLDEFIPITTQMAREQNLSLNPQKISGNCGRLLCCLAYESDTYRHACSVFPKIGASIETPDGPGRVEKINIFRGTIVLRFEDGVERKFTLAEINRFRKRGFRIFKTRHKAI